MLFSQYGNTATVSATTTSASASVPRDTNSLLVVNAGTVVVFVKTGVTSATAASTSTPVGAGATAYISKDPTHDTVAVIAASTTATVYVAAGNAKL